MSKMCNSRTHTAAQLALPCLAGQICILHVGGCGCLQLLLMRITHALQHVRGQQRVQHVLLAAARGQQRLPSLPGLLSLSLLLPQAVQLLLNLGSAGDQTLLWQPKAVRA